MVNDNIHIFAEAKTTLLSVTAKARYIYLNVLGFTFLNIQRNGFIYQNKFLTLNRNNKTINYGSIKN